MPVVACPKCPTQLKIPDGVSGNVKCPKCGTIFPTAGTAPKPSFEVVGGAAPAPRAPKPRQAKAAPADDEDDFEVIDEKPRKKARRDYDEEDEEEDARPRSRKRRRAGDDDENDRPRRKPKKQRRDRDDDYEDDWQPPKRKGGGFRSAKTGAMLLGVGMWLYLGAFGLMALFALIGWAGGELPNGLVVVAGLVGLSNWVVSLVGLGFCIAGPARARGMAIAATVVSAIHLVLSFVCFGNLDGGMRGFGGFGVGSSFGWAVLTSVLPALDAGLPLLIYQSRAFGGEFLVAFLAGACEVARLILVILTLKGLARAARDGYAAERSGSAVMAVAGVCGGVALAALLVAVVVIEGKLMRSGLHLFSAAVLLSYIAYACMTIAPALLAKDVKDSLDRRA